MDKEERSAIKKGNSVDYISYSIITLVGIALLVLSYNE
jgi:hypothetical protein